MNLHKPDYALEQNIARLLDAANPPDDMVATGGMSPERRAMMLNTLKVHQRALAAPSTSGVDAFFAGGSRSEPETAESPVVSSANLKRRYLIMGMLIGLAMCAILALVVGLGLGGSVPADSPVGPAFSASPTTSSSDGPKALPGGITSPSAHRKSPSASTSHLPRRPGPRLMPGRSPEHANGQAEPFRKEFDIDRDGMPDVYELAHNLNRQRPDALDDLDGDGFLNITEMARGSDPNDATDPGFLPYLFVKNMVQDQIPVMLTDYAALGQGQYLLTLHTRAGRFVAKRIGEQIPLTPEQNDMLLLERFEAKKDPNAKAALLVRRLSDGSEHRIERGRAALPHRVAKLGCMVGSVDWVTLSSGMREVQFRGQRLSFNHWSSEGIFFKDARYDKGTLIGTSPQFGDPNTRAREIQRTAIRWLEHGRLADKVLGDLQALNWDVAPPKDTPKPPVITRSGSPLGSPSVDIPRASPNVPAPIPERRDVIGLPPNDVLELGPAGGVVGGQIWGDPAGDPAAQIPALHDVGQPPFGEQALAVLEGPEAIARHSGWLTGGHKALLRKYPGFKMPVYPSHRTARLPAKIYANSAANARNCRLKASGLGVIGFKPGIAFPRSSDALELVWNHLLRWRGPDVKRTINQFVIGARGNIELDAVIKERVQWFFNKNGNGDLARFLQVVQKPIAVAGKKNFFIEPMDHAQNRQTWCYNTALRKVVRAPGVAFDVPGTVSHGQRTVDNFDMFSGSPEQYNWRLLRPEPVPRIVPYNALPLNAFGLADNYTSAVEDGHLKTQALRYEVHRVWIVEGTLKRGENNSQKKRVFYIDEDSCAILSSDIYDANGLWRVQESHGYQHSVGCYLECAMTVQDLRNNKMLLHGVVGELDFVPNAPQPFHPRDLLSNR